MPLLVWLEILPIGDISKCQCSFSQRPLAENFLFPARRGLLIFKMFELEEKSLSSSKKEMISFVWCYFFHPLISLYIFCY